MLLLLEWSCLSCLNKLVGNNLSEFFSTEIITHPQEKLVAVNSRVNFTCTSSLSSNVTFSWTHNGTISKSSTTGDTSILTITSAKNSDAGSYVCTVRSGSVSVMSSTAILRVYGKFFIYTCILYRLYYIPLYRLPNNHKSPNWV